MKRYIVTYTSDYYSGGPSIGLGGFKGDFDTLEEALAVLNGRMRICSAADILDTVRRRVLTLVEAEYTGAQEWEALA